MGSEMCIRDRFLPLVGVRTYEMVPPQSGRTPGLLAMLGRFSIAQVVKSTWAGATMVPQSRQDSMGLYVNDLLKWRRSRTSGSIHEDIPADVGWAMFPVGLPIEWPGGTLGKPEIHSRI